MEEQKTNSPFEFEQQESGNTTEQLKQIVRSSESITSQAEHIVSEAVKKEYAGFWVRFAAMLVDGLILVVPSIIVSMIFGKNLGFFLQYVLMWTYAIYMLNTKQATFGKMVVGIKVTTLDDQVVSIEKLALREIVGKAILNMLTLGIGYIMIAFTAKKQGLHDMISGTIVVYDPIRKRRPWITVVAVIAFLIIPIGILVGVILVSTNSAKNKAYSRSVEASLTAAMARAKLYYHGNKNSYLGFKLDTNFKINTCDTQPTVNISPDGQDIAIIVKNCGKEKKYFCNPSGINEAFEISSYPSASESALCSPKDGTH